MLATLAVVMATVEFRVVENLFTLPV